MSDPHQPNAAVPPAYSPPPPQPEGATGSLVCGILSLFIPVVGLVLGIIAIVLGNRARKEPNGGLGTAGFVLGIIGTVLNAISVVWIIIAIVAAFTVVEHVGRTSLSIIPMIFPA
jgi:hypothetical protein